MPCGKFVFTTTRLETESIRSELVDKVPAQQGRCRVPVGRTGVAVPKGRDLSVFRYLGLLRAGDSRKWVSTGRILTRLQA